MARPANTARTPTTPTVRRALRRSLFWIVAVVSIIGVGLAIAAISQKATLGAPFGADNAGPTGSEALARVLHNHGVNVHKPASLAAAEAATDGATATLFLYDPDGYLTTADLTKLAKTAQAVVLLDPTYNQLRAVAPATGLAGIVNATELTAGCTLRAAAHARTVSGGGKGYRVIDHTANTVSCFGSGDGVYSLIQTTTGDNHTVTVLGTLDALTNDHITEQGNAALALTILGTQPALVWYQPTIADSKAAGGQTLGELTPPWVTPTLILVIVVSFAAALWRGRRFGPLVIENMPVVVRSSETMHGRARLYQKSGARQHALDALRIGTLSRLARTLGLPRTATVDDIIIAANSSVNTTSDTLTEMRELLVEAVPASDRLLVQLSDELLALERRVSSSIRPSEPPKPPSDRATEPRITEPRITEQKRMIE